jgi:hypothetical protein
MPRPKRTKVTVAAARVAKPAPPKQQPKNNIRSQKQPVPTKESFSEDSDGLVVKAKTTRPRRKLPGQKSPTPVNDAELIMTGALPVEIDDAVPMNKPRTPVADASRNTRRPRNSRSSAIKTSPAVAASMALHPDAVSVIAEPLNFHDSGFDLTLSSFGSESPAHGTRPPSAIKVGATPAHEASVLALTNFKRRPRQPSLLRMVQQNTDVEDNSDSNLDDTENFDFDEFVPQAESTPLNIRQSVHDDTRNDSGTHISRSGSRGVKRKVSPVIQVPRSSPTYDPPSGADIESVRSSSPSLPEVLASREEIIGQSQEEGEPLSQTYAPPMSSSPVREVSEHAPSPVQRRTARGRPRKTPKYDDSDSEEIETPAKQRRGAQRKAKQNISTAQLKGLLPRRRNRALRDEFDLESSEITTFDSDQDELQMPNLRTRQRPTAGKLTSPRAAKKIVRGKKAPLAKPSRTYSRRISSDKENETEIANVEEPTEASVNAHSERLEAIRKRFAEVDSFQLEFETVDVTTSSSPFR